MTGVNEQKSSPAQRKGSGLGLRGRMICAMMAAALIPLLLFAGVVYYTTNQSLQQEVEGRIKQAAIGLSDQVAEWYQLSLRAATVTAQLPEIKTLDPVKVLPVLKAVNSQYPWMYNVKIHDRTGMALARSDDKKLKSYVDRQYFQEAMDGKDEVWQTLIGRTSKKATLVFAAPIRQDDEIIGVAVASGTIDKVKKWIVDWKAGKTGYAALIQRNGKIIVHPDKQLYEDQINLADHGHPLAVMFREGKTGALRYTRADGVEMFGYVAGTPMGWGVFIEQEMSEVFNLVRFMEKLFSGFLLGGALLAILLGLFFSNIITRPILQLTKATEEMSLGKIDVPIEIQSTDEINNLAEAISRLQLSLRIAMRKLQGK